MSRVTTFGRAVVPGLIVLLVGAVRVSAQTLPSIQVVTRSAEILARAISGADVVTTVVQGTILDVTDSDNGWYWASLPPDRSGDAAARMDSGARRERGHCRRPERRST